MVFHKLIAFNLLQQSLPSSILVVSSDAFIALCRRAVVVAGDDVVTVNLQCNCKN